MNSLMKADGACRLTIGLLCLVADHGSTNQEVVATPCRRQTHPPHSNTVFSAPHAFPGSRPDLQMSIRTARNARRTAMSDVSGFKVRFAERSHSPVGRTADHLYSSLVLSHSAVACCDDTFIAGDRGRKRFDPRYSTEDLHHDGKKILPAPKSGYEEKRGKRCIKPSPSAAEIAHATRRHLEPLIPARANPAARGLPSLTWNRKKAVLDEKGVPVSQADSQQFNMETAMNRKQRVLSTLEQRNHIPEASAGDHSYKAADREPGFYAKGGLIAGSTNSLRASAKPTLRKSEDVSAQSQSKPLEATYAKLKQRLAHEYDLQQVLSLTVESSKQSQRVPSWEERTGCWLVSPQDEAF